MALNAVPHWPMLHLPRRRNPFDQLASEWNGRPIVRVFATVSSRCLFDRCVTDLLSRLSHNMKSTSSIRIHDLPLDTSEDALLEYRHRMILESASRRRFWQRATRETDDDPDDASWSLAVSRTLSVATISFPCESQKKHALKDRTFRRSTDDDFLGITVLHSPATIDVE